MVWAVRVRGADRSFSVQAGMNDYMSKPVSLDELVKAIAKLTSRPSVDCG